MFASPTLLKQVHYTIRPASARPAKVHSRAYTDVYDFNLDQVELSALREVLQTALGANPFSSFIRRFLAPYSDWLVWLGDGPGIGREMRRTFSALFGRFFARAYLSDCHGFVWFAPLDGPTQFIGARLRVRSTGRQDLPDWICAGQRHLALGEAKGARGRSRLTHYSQPSAVRQGVRQLENCQVSVYDRNNRTWVGRRTKGWCVYNQWCFQSSNVVYPWLYVADPETNGEELLPNDIPILIRSVARQHVVGLLRGLELYSLIQSLSIIETDPFSETFSALPEHSLPPEIVSVPELGDVRAMGRFFNLNAGDVVDSINFEQMFIGIQSDVIENLKENLVKPPLHYSNRIALMLSFVGPMA